MPSALEKQPKPNKIKTIRPETLEFIMLYNELRGKTFSNNGELAEALGFNNASSITEIVKRRQNIDPEKFRLFKERYGIANTAQATSGHTPAGIANGIPMYNIGSDVSQDIERGQPVGHMNFPGIEECDFALPVWGDSMQPCLEHGCWVALKIIQDKKVLPGEVYYIEWGDYRMYRRLLAGDAPGEVIAHADNEAEMIGTRHKYAPFTIKTAEISKLALVKHIHRRI